MRRVVIAAIAVFSYQFGDPAIAQSVEQEAELRAPTIVVIGTQQEQAETFVAEIAPPAGLAKLRGVPRWNTELCTGVIGPPAEQAQFIADRITQRAMDAGVEGGAPGCDTNLLIIVTNDPATLLPLIAEKHRAVFGFTGDANIDTSGSETSLASFIANTRPVRWRQVIETVGADGMPIDGEARVDGLKLGQPDISNLPLVRADSTRLRSNVRRQISRIVMVVDTTQTKGLNLGAVSDYLAFAALAEIDPDADISDFPSILNLFNPQAEHPEGMSNWDTSLLKALYSARLKGAGGSMQYTEIVREMVKQ